MSSYSDDDDASSFEPDDFAERLRKLILQSESEIEQQRAIKGRKRSQIYYAYCVLSNLLNRKNGEYREGKIRTHQACCALRSLKMIRRRVDR